MSRNTKRCSYTKTDGRRCGEPCLPAGRGAPGRESLCLNHWKQRQRERQAVATADELLGNSSEFHTATDVNRLLGNLVSLVAHDRIPTRKATVIAYIVQLLMNSLAGMQREAYTERICEEFEDVLRMIQQARDKMQQDAKRDTLEDVAARAELARAAKRSEARTDVQIAYVPPEEAKN